MEVGAHGDGNLLLMAPLQLLDAGALLVVEQGGDVGVDLEGEPVNENLPQLWSFLKSDRPSAERQYCSNQKAGSFFFSCKRKPKDCSPKIAVVFTVALIAIVSPMAGKLRSVKTLISPVSSRIM